MPERKAGGGEISVRRDAACWTVALDRPEKANALSAAMVEALIAMLDEAQAARVPAVVFRGEGRNLSAGFDFTGYESESEGDLVHRLVRIETLLQAIARSPCLTVALAHGRNFGAGVDLFAACRWRIAAPGTTFRMPGLAFGLVLGTRRFAAIVGRDAAREILESAATFDAERAHALGLVRRIAAEDAWPSLVEEACAASRALPEASRAALYRALDGATDDADLADLVRSAAAPGLKRRIADYLAAQKNAPRA
ncbi:MAG TPA: enoyl-CoA hydratase/isomerase family protein [Usitatibacter sp.]|jgi:enoyl-CoA hydratase/carnithine racemase|nr:enoyl-CoA hydratase/isomerase family protein [Usitatibacter sp.]